MIFQVAMASANLKAFVSETELDEQRQKRQEEWEKVRTADQPEECPEEVYDPRSLFEKLQEQKDKKQSDFDEQHKFKNMIRGIDDGESKFLNDVAERQMKIDMERMSEEKRLIKEYKESVVNRTVTLPAQNAAPSRSSDQKKVTSGSKRSQAALLAGVIKRKRPASTDDSKKPSEDSVTSSSDSTNPGSSVPTSDPTRDPDTSSSSESGDKIVPDSRQQVQCIAVLPGIGSYSNSSEESDSDSSYSDGPDTVKTVFHAVGRRTKCEGK